MKTYKESCQLFFNVITFHGRSVREKQYDRPARGADQKLFATRNAVDGQNSAGKCVQNPFKLPGPIRGKISCAISYAAWFKNILPITERSSVVGFPLFAKEII